MTELFDPTLAALPGLPSAAPESPPSVAGMSAAPVPRSGRITPQAATQSNSPVSSSLAIIAVNPPKTQGMWSAAPPPPPAPRCPAAAARHLLRRQPAEIVPGSGGEVRTPALAAICASAPKAISSGPRRVKAATCASRFGSGAARASISSRNAATSRRRHQASVGITKSAPARMPVGQRDVTVLSLVKKRTPSRPCMA